MKYKVLLCKILYVNLSVHYSLPQRSYPHILQTNNTRFLLTQDTNIENILLTSPTGPLTHKTVLPDTLFITQQGPPV